MENQNYKGFKQNYEKATLGQFGFKKLTTGETSLVSDVFIAIQVLEDCEFTANIKGSGDNNFNDTLIAGTIIYGEFYNINVVSGKILAYLKTY